jgi:hypothetical protein
MDERGWIDLRTVGVNASADLRKKDSLTLISRDVRPHVDAVPAPSI